MRWILDSGFVSTHESTNRRRGNDSSIVNRTSRTRLTWSFATDIKPNSNGPPRNGQDPGADREPAEQIESQLGQVHGQGAYGEDEYGGACPTLVRSYRAHRRQNRIGACCGLSFALLMIAGVFVGCEL